MTTKELITEAEDLIKNKSWTEAKKKLNKASIKCKGIEERKHIISLRNFIYDNIDLKQKETIPYKKNSSNIPDCTSCEG